jgi:hypothetical protein
MLHLFFIACTDAREEQRLPVLDEWTYPGPGSMQETHSKERDVKRKGTRKQNDVSREQRKVLPASTVSSPCVSLVILASPKRTHEESFFFLAHRITFIALERRAKEKTR